jgi:hypothetical protein
MSVSRAGVCEHVSVGSPEPFRYVHENVDGALSDKNYLARSICTLGNAFRANTCRHTLAMRVNLLGQLRRLRLRRHKPPSIANFSQFPDDWDRSGPVQ